MEWRPAGWSVCLPLLIFPRTIKSRSSLLAPAHPGGPGKRAVKQLCVWVCVQVDNHTSISLLIFLQAGCSSWCPTNSVKAVKALASIPRHNFPSHTTKNTEKQTGKQTLPKIVVKRRDNGDGDEPICMLGSGDVIQNTEQNSSDNLPSYHPGNDHSSHDVYWRGGE